MNMYTYPTMGEMDYMESITPDYMYPNKIPQAAIAVGYLVDSECDAIVRTLNALPVGGIKGCRADTRQCPRPLPDVLDPLVAFAQKINAVFWNYDLDPEPMAWMQTYSKGGNYNRHVDFTPGQMRKLTAVAFLTDEKDYEGGDLTLIDVIRPVPIPRERGTIVVFPPWMMHEVGEITSGVRQSINLGFWGPPFK